MNLSFPYDEEIFNYSWKQTPDLYLNTMIESGAVVVDSEIANLISNGSNYFTTPYYDILTGSPQTYNGVNDIATASLTGGYYAGVVYGRQQGWEAKSFINDFNSGADPMQQIVSGVARFWVKERQKRMLSLLNALFGITGNTEWAKHITDISTTGTAGTATVADANLIGATTINDACVKACGDNAQDFSLAIMHSTVANRLANLQLIEFSKYTDPAGITAPIRIGHINGLTVIINDNVPVADSTATTGAKEYTTYVLGNGSLRFASAPVEKPSEMDRDPAKNGGKDFIYTRIRETLAPYGFSFKGDHTTDVGIPDSVLGASASWELKMPAKAVMMVKVVTNG